MDFPNTRVLPFSVHSASMGLSTAYDAYVLVSSPSVASYNWPAQNQAVYMPIAIPWPYPVYRVFWVAGSSPGGNMDFGIYTSGGTKIYSTGATSSTVASDVQYVSVGTPFVLSPGSYYFALSNDSATTTNRALGFNIATVEGQAAGFKQQSSASPLPASATFASWTSTGVPFCGIARTSSGF